MWLPDEAATAALGRALGEHAKPGTVIALQGDLGMGKSVLARGIGRGLGLTQRLPSPTFIILATYADGRLPYYHADFYRLSDPEELVQLGLEDVLGVDGVCVIEWAERFPAALPEDRLEITLTEEGDGRRVRFRALGPGSRELESQLG